MKPILLALLLTACASLAVAQDPTPTPEPTSSPTPPAKVDPRRIQKLDFFDKTLYNVEPFLDAALLLPKEKFDAIVAANKAHKSNPEVEAAKKAVAAASDDAKADAKQALWNLQRASDKTRKAVLEANLTDDMTTIIRTLNSQVKPEQKRARDDAGLTGLPKDDPQFAEARKKASELEREYLLAMIASALSETQKAAIEKARNP